MLEHAAAEAKRIAEIGYTHYRRELREQQEARDREILRPQPDAPTRPPEPPAPEPDEQFYRDRDRGFKTWTDDDPNLRMIDGYPERSR